MRLGGAVAYRLDAAIVEAAHLLGDGSVREFEPACDSGDSMAVIHNKTNPLLSTARCQAGIAVSGGHYCDCSFGPPAMCCWFRNFSLTGSGRMDNILRL